MKAVLFCSCLLLALVLRSDPAQLQRRQPLTNGYLSTLAKEKAAKIRDSMTEAEVHRVLGKADQVEAGPAFVRKRWILGGGNEITVLFRGGKVLRKSVMLGGAAKVRPAIPPKPPPPPKH